jgi:ABC-type nitrate/sulfonate/bicarbonate transport system permease component
MAIQAEVHDAASRASRGWLSRERLVQIAAVGLFLIGWEVVGRQVSRLILAPPSSVAVAFAEMLGNGDLVTALGQSLTGLAIGFGCALVLGISIGLLMGWSRDVADVLNPFISAIYVVPIASLVPLLVLWLGIGMRPRALTVMLFCVFEIMISTSVGVREVDQRLVEMARSFGATRRQLFGKVVFFDALPVVFSGLRIGLSRAVQGMVTAELLFAVTGLGGLVMTYSANYRIDRVLVIIALISLIGLLLVTLVQLIERRLTPWKR